MLLFTAWHIFAHILTYLSLKYEKLSRPGFALVQRKEKIHSCPFKMSQHHQLHDDGILTVNCNNQKLDSAV